jgi:hypothetical protein
MWWNMFSMTSFGSWSIIVVIAFDPWIQTAADGRAGIVRWLHLVSQCGTFCRTHHDYLLKYFSLIPPPEYSTRKNSSTTTTTKKIPYPCQHRIH